MTGLRRLALTAVALAACVEPEQAVEQTKEKAEELGKRAADKVQDVADKTRADAKMMARETAEEARRVADKAGEQLGDAAEQVSQVGVDGIPEAAPPEEVRAALTDLDAAVKCDGAGKCTVARDFFERLKARPDVLAAQAKCESAQAGASVGMQIQNLGDLPRKLGFEAGDVLTAINGVALTGNDAMPQLVLQLGKSSFRIEFLRDGSEQSLQIDVV
ncbi:MAG TPA: hypothetical protein VFG69_13585 [Nannocystaceae bacterium]|nr:hypothetical protein [Nannocystaceae bacterium]